MSCELEYKSCTDATENALVNLGFPPLPSVGNGWSGPRPALLFFYSKIYTRAPKSGSPFYASNHVFPAKLPDNAPQRLAK